MVRGRIRRFISRYRRAIGVVLVLSMIFTGIAYYNVAPYADACNGHFSDRGLDAYFKNSGRDGLSWGSAYVFDGGQHSDSLQEFSMIFDHTTRHVIIKDYEFIDSSASDEVPGGAIKITHSQNIKIMGCRFNGGDAGVFIEYSQNLEISDSLFDSLAGTGLQMNHVHQVLVENNSFINNGMGIGISEGTHSTTLTLNNLTSNTVHAYDASQNACLWCYNGLGNYWDDYFRQIPNAAVSHANPNLDSMTEAIHGAVFIGLSPYLINSGTQDDFPLVFLPNSMPIINISLPVEGRVWGEESPEYNLIITGYLVTSAWYTFDNITNYTIGGSSDFPFTSSKPFSGKINQSHWEMIVSGRVSISFYAKTWFGAEGVQQVHVDKDIVAPIISIGEPTPDHVFGSTPPTFSLSISEDHLAEMWYSCNSADVIVPFQGTAGTISTFYWGACGDRYVFIHFFARDVIGNIGSTTVRVRKDTVPPAILLALPTAGQVFGNSSVSYQFESLDIQLDSAWVAINGDRIVEFGEEGIYAGVIPMNAWNACQDGPVDLCFGSNDTLGNVQEQPMTIYKDSMPPVVNFDFVHSDIEGRIPPEIFWTYNDASAVVAAWYTVGDSPDRYNIQVDAFTFTLDAAIWSTLPDGQVIVNLFVKDICGNIGSFSRFMIKDTSMPSIIITKPLPNEIYGRNSPSYEIHVADLALESIEYHLDGSQLCNHIAIESGYNGVFSGHFNNDWWNMLPDGVLNVTFEFSDVLGNAAVASVVIRKDTCPPIISIVQPVMNGVVSAIPPVFEVNASDPSYLHRIWYSLDGGRTLIFLPLNTFTGSFDYDRWGLTFEPGKNLTIVFWANDTLGNVACAAVILKCEELNSWDIFQGRGLFASLLVLSVALLVAIIVLEVKHHPKGGRRLG